MEKRCEQCDNVFIINEKLKVERNKRFCSSFCSKQNTGLKNKNRKHSEEVNKSKGLSGELNPMFNKTHSDELKKQINKTKLETNLKNVKYCKLTDIEKEVLDGIMISDGCLTSVTAISARLSLGFKYNETIEDIKIALPSIIFGPTNIVNNGLSFHNKSKMYGDLLSENKRWYVNSKKIIPNDIKITKNLCYWWFICDGHNSNENVYLCTDSFTKEDNLLLCYKFSELGFKCSLTTRNRIRFYKTDSKKFLKWITPTDGVHKQYEYKWKN